MPKERGIFVNQLQNNTAQIFIYGYIGDDVDAADVSKAIKSLEASNSSIVFRINSGGGSIFEGLAIYNAIKQCKVPTVGRIDGLGGSMGSVIPLACNRVEMSKVAMIMTHRASGFTGGSANDMRNTAQVMESLEAAICSIYAGKTGLTCEEAKAKYLCPEDRWITADQALSEKLIDGIYDLEDVKAPAASMRNDKDLLAFYNSSLNYDKFKIDMIKLELTAAQAMALGLIGTETETSKAAAIDAVIAKAKKTETLELELRQEKAKTDAAEKKYNDKVIAESADKVKAIVDAGIAAKKLTVELGTQLTADYATKPEELKKLVDAMPGYTSITSKIDEATKKNEELENKTWEELDKSGGLEELKASNIELFKKKYQAAFGKEYVEAK